MDIMIINAAMFLVVGSLMVVLAHKIANWRMRRHHPELIDGEGIWQSNAFVLRRMGLYGAVLLGTFAVVQNISEAHHATELLSAALTPSLLTESALGLISVLLFVFTALRSVDWVILSDVDNDKAVVENNYAVGLTECAILLGTGLVAYGSLLGEGHITSSWAFFVIGQVVFVFISYLMEYVIHPDHNAKSDISKGCMSSAITVSVMLLVVAMFVKNGIAGDFYGYAKDVPYFLKMFGLQFGLFMVYQFVLEPVLLSIMKLNRQSLNGAMIKAVMQLTMAGSIVYSVSL